MLTERCNLSCQHCAVPAEDSPADHELTTSEWHRTLSAFAQAGLRDLVLSGGEVTLRSDAVYLAKFGLAAGIERCTIVTNGTRLSDRLVDELASAQQMFAKLYVHVSLDGASSETHDWMRGEGTFSRSITGLKRLRDAGGRVDGVHTVLHRGNRHETSRVAGLAGELGAWTWTVFPIAALGRGASIAEQSLPKSDWKTLFTELPALAKQNALDLSIMGPILGADWPAFVGDEIPRPRSPRPDRLCIGPDGEAFACPPLRSRPVGHALRAASIGKVEAAAIANRLAQQLEATCATCQFLFLCTSVDPSAKFTRVELGHLPRDPRQQTAPVVLRGRS